MFINVVTYKTFISWYLIGINGVEPFVKLVDDRATHHCQQLKCRATREWKKAIWLSAICDKLVSKSTCLRWNIGRRKRKVWRHYDIYLYAVFRKIYWSMAYSYSLQDTSFSLFLKILNNHIKHFFFVDQRNPFIKSCLSLFK